ncbi:MAG: hypothetical protein Q4B91_03555 [Atopobiaceae bacterium]|nr:hypothetical protein [Atopobiaceae bacterium]
MSAPSPLPEGVRRDLERMAGPLAERMLPPKVTQSATTRNVVAAVNPDGTVDVMMGGAVMQHVPATTACVGVAVGDEVIVEQYGPRLYCVGVIAKSLDTRAYVIEDFGPFEPYASNTRPTVYRCGGVVSLVGACRPTRTIEAGGSGVLFYLPEWARPPQAVVAQCQGSQTRKWALAIAAAGDVTMSRYCEGSTDVPCHTNNWLPLAATWVVGG